MTRSAFHRTKSKAGPWSSWRQRVALNLGRVFGAVSAGEELLRFDWPDAPLAYKAARYRFRLALERIEPLRCDEDGSAWE